MCGYMVGRGPCTADWLFCLSGCFLGVVLLPGLLSFMLFLFVISSFVVAETGVCFLDPIHTVEFVIIV